MFPSFLLSPSPICFSLSTVTTRFHSKADHRFLLSPSAAGTPASWLEHPRDTPSDPGKQDLVIYPVGQCCSYRGQSLDFGFKSSCSPQEEKITTTLSTFITSETLSGSKGPMQEQTCTPTMQSGKSICSTKSCSRNIAQLLTTCCREQSLCALKAAPGWFPKPVTHTSPGAVYEMFPALHFTDKACLPGATARCCPREHLVSLLPLPCRVPSPGNKR